MKRIVLLIVGILGVFGVVLLFGKEEKEQVYLTNKEIKESNYIAVMIEQEDGKYQEEDAIPQSGYALNEEKSKCNNGTIPTWTNNRLKLSNLTSDNTSCYLYFEMKQSKKVVTQLGLEVKEGTPDFSQTACDSGCESTDKGLYKTEDDDGETFYFRGSVNNNWVKFAGYYWRIIRINGDGTIRLIYSGDESGTNVDFPGSNRTNPAYVTGTGIQVTISGSNTSAFNGSNNQNRYVGYMYGNSSSTYDTDHANQASSNIKSKLESWYSTDLANVGISGTKTAKDYIDKDAGFCGDRTPYNGSSSSYNIDYSKGGSTTTTYYGGYFKLIVNKTPDLHCKRQSGGSTSTTLPETNDLYTVNSSNKGNKVLGSPVGLISADEVSYAGGKYVANNQGYYLYTGQEYWTMSPSYFVGSNYYAQVFRVYSNGHLDGASVSAVLGVRPVINLKADTKLITVSNENKGTFSNPYVVEGAN